MAEVNKRLLGLLNYGDMMKDYKPFLSDEFIKALSERVKAQGGDPMLINQLYQLQGEFEQLSNLKFTEHTKSNRDGSIDTHLGRIAYHYFYLIFQLLDQDVRDYYGDKCALLENVYK